MDERYGRRDADGSYIWLRHTMQVNSGKRAHTLHVDIPVPHGASADARERLIREAEAAMEQLADHIEGQTFSARALQFQPQPQRPQPQPQLPSQPAASANPPARSASAAVTPSPATRPPMPVPAASAAPANAAPPREPTRPAQPAQETAQPPTRQTPTIGASMPSIAGDSGGSLTITQFLQCIKELGLDAKQAMKYLQVKSLSDLNYREALDQLQQIILREQAGQTSAQTAPAQIVRDGGNSDNSATDAAKPERRAAPSSPSVGAAPARAPRSSPDLPNTVMTANASQAPAPKAPPRPSSQIQANTTASVPPGIIELKDAVLREAPRGYFDEEVDFEDEGDGPDLLDVGDDDDFMSALTDLERETAQEILSRLQEAHGSSNASDARLRVLRTVVNNQVPDDRLDELIQGVWGVSALRKLKDEQLEALISWAKKADDFIAEVDIVLAFLEEEQYAGSDR
jgi:hypothetical protein